MNTLSEKTGADLKSTFAADNGVSEKVFIIPPARTRYLSEIAESNRAYDRWASKQADLAGRLQAICTAKNEVDESALKGLQNAEKQLELDLDPRLHDLKAWPELQSQYAATEFVFQVRGEDVRIPTTTTSLSHQEIPKWLSFDDGLEGFGKMVLAREPSRCIPIYVRHLPVQARR